MLGSVECDAVMVFTSDAHHAECCVPALEAGKYVYTEKPLDTTLEKCRAVINADERAGGKTFVGFNLRYAPIYAAVKREIEKGSIGRVLTIQADEFYDGGRTYFRRWNRLRSEGGGLWITKASHDFDLIYWLAGRPQAREMYAVADRTYYVPKPDAGPQCRNCKIADTCPDRVKDTNWRVFKVREENGGEPWDLCLYTADSDTFDHGIATMLFEPDIMATYTCNVVAGFTDRRIRVSGTKGTLDGSLSGDRVTLRRRDPGETVEVNIEKATGGHGGADSNVLESFFAFARGEAEPKCRPREAAEAIRLGLAATRASDEHRVVPMRDDHQCFRRMGGGRRNPHGVQ